MPGASQKTQPLLLPGQQFFARKKYSRPTLNPSATRERVGSVGQKLAVLELGEQRRRQPAVFAGVHPFCGVIVRCAAFRRRDMCRAFLQLFGNYGNGPFSPDGIGVAETHRSCTSRLMMSMPDGISCGASISEPREVVIRPFLASAWRIWQEV